MKVFSTILMLSLFTQTAQATSPGETHGTAYTLESGNWELGHYAEGLTTAWKSLCILLRPSKRPILRLRKCGQKAQR
jgi:hypothetical protein